VAGVKIRVDFTASSLNYYRLVGTDEEGKGSQPMNYKLAEGKKGVEFFTR